MISNIYNMYSDQPSLVAPRVGSPPAADTPNDRVGSLCLPPLNERRDSEVSACIGG